MTLTMGIWEYVLGQETRISKNANSREEDMEGVV